MLNVMKQFWMQISTKTDNYIQRKNIENNKN